MSWHRDDVTQWVCRGCFRTYAEYVNGCVWCWDDDLTVNANRAKYPDRKVVAVSDLIAREAPHE